MSKVKKVAMVLVLVGFAVFGFAVGTGAEEKETKTLEEVQKTDTCVFWITDDGRLCLRCSDGWTGCTSG